MQPKWLRSPGRTHGERAHATRARRRRRDGGAGCVAPFRRRDDPVRCGGTLRHPGHARPPHDRPRRAGRLGARVRRLGGGGLHRSGGPALRRLRAEGLHRRAGSGRNRTHAVARPWARRRQPADAPDGPRGGRGDRGGAWFDAGDSGGHAAHLRRRRRALRVAAGRADAEIRREPLRRDPSPCGEDRGRGLPDARAPVRQLPRRPRNADGAGGPRRNHARDRRGADCAPGARGRRCWGNSSTRREG
jgi:hypothetical protein